jgi:pimeloyl-ACP methyl ester carboxylesterase
MWQESHAYNFFLLSEPSIESEENMRKTILNARIARFFLSLSIFAAGIACHAQNEPTAPAKNVILVHGAFADGNSWAKLIPLLEAKGYNVVAVQLPLSSFSGDVDTVRREIARAKGPIVLVGHSYGGAVITEAGNDSQVSSLVYVAAFAPDRGESALALSQTDPAPTGDELRPDKEGYLKLTDRGIKDDFAQDLSPNEIALLTAAQAPTSVKSLSGLITTPAWKNKPSWYIIASHDRAISPKSEDMMSSKIGATTTILPSSHVVMLSHPDDVATVIDAAAHGRKR